MSVLIKKRVLAEYSHVVEDDAKPSKILCLSQKTSQQNILENEISLLNNSSHSNETINILLRIKDILQYNKKANVSLYNSLIKLFSKENEASIRSIIISLLGHTVTVCNLDIKNSVEDLLHLLKNEPSHKVKSQSLQTFLTLAQTQTDCSKFSNLLVQYAKNMLLDSYYLVICNALELLTFLIPGKEIIFNYLKEHIHNQDPRVRSAAFRSLSQLHYHGQKIDYFLYPEICSALQDDYECVRQIALQLIFAMSQDFSEHLISIAGSDEKIRLVDDVFGKICNSINDISVAVRVEATQLLGHMTNLSQKFLEQTLDKKIMSNMRKKRSAHERQLEIVTSGEWSSGKKWGDDAPQELLEADTVSLISSGACGAFVLGLEDEFMEVRGSAVDSLCQLALQNPSFALLSLDFLVDMFNDEIEDIRLKAIGSLERISQYIVLREDQLETILAVLEDSSLDIREALHHMLSSCKLHTKDGLKMCIDNLMGNLKRYPQDRRGIWKCLRHLGSNHPYLTLELVPFLLGIHPYLDMPEPDMEDPASKHCPTMLPLLEEHTICHYHYLRDSIPNLVPELTIFGRKKELTSLCQISKTRKFLQQVLDQLQRAEFLNFAQQQILYTTCCKDLERIAQVEPNLCSSATFACIYVESYLLFTKVVCNKKIEDNNNLIIMEQLSYMVNKLQYMFKGMTDDEYGSLLQFHFKVLALYFICAVNTTSSSFLENLFDALKRQGDNLNNYAKKYELIIESVVQNIYYELKFSDQHSFIQLATKIERILLTHQLPPILLKSQLCMATAVIYEPTGDSDTALRFSAGLILGIQFDCEVNNIVNIKLLRIQICYPDQQIHLITPKSSDLRPLGDHSYRILTTVLVSHHVWSEPCHIELTVVLNASCLSAKRQQSFPKPKFQSLQLCNPVRIYVSPKLVRKGI